MSKYFYARVSTKEQNLGRQLAAAEKYSAEYDGVFADKKTGANFERDEYQRMKSLLKRGDEIIISALDRLGRNKEEVKDEYAWFKAHGVTLRILDLPTSLIDFNGQDWIKDMIDNILIEVLSSMAQQERESMLIRQREGIAAMPVVDGKRVSAKSGRGFGRPRVDVDISLLAGESIKQACERLGISRQTYYNHRKLQ